MRMIRFWLNYNRSRNLVILRGFSQSVNWLKMVLLSGNFVMVFYVGLFVIRFVLFFPVLLHLQFMLYFPSYTRVL
jgi:hypothetical protein